MLTIPYKTYLVGGAVRDELLGRPYQERDWVVVGATPAGMLDLGFQQVGKSFPVFLHPETKEEYALARHEYKIGKGYQGFQFDTTPNITLEDDLQRRDLTINAIARDANGELIDPYDGQADLKAKILRHVSPAFVEDPVRVLRIARFAARFGDFNVAPDTNQLMQTMVKNGEVDALVADRIWKEWEKALMENNPERFYQVLHASGALARICPELTTVMTTASSTLTTLMQACVALHASAEIRFAVTMFLLDPKNLANNQRQFQQLAQRLPLPNSYKSLAELVITYVARDDQQLSYTPQQLLTLLKSTDAFRREQRFQEFVSAMQLLLSMRQSPYLDISLQQLTAAYQAAIAITIDKINTKGLHGAEIGKALDLARLHAIQQAVPCR